MIYLYAITKHSSKALPSLSGIMNLPLEKITIQKVDAIVSHCDKVPENPSAAVLWKHEAVIEALMKDQCTLPVRYGMCLANSNELENFICAKNASFMEDLDRLDGCVEVSLRVIHAGSNGATMPRALKKWRDAKKENKGKEYLLERFSQMKRSMEEEGALSKWAEDMHTQLLEISRAGTFTLHTHPLLMTTGAYLLKKEQLYPFQVRIGEMRTIHRMYKFLCTGPWPPYNFVTPSQISVQVN